MHPRKAFFHILSCVVFIASAAIANQSYAAEKKQSSVLIAYNLEDNPRDEHYRHTSRIAVEKWLKHAKNTTLHEQNGMPDATTAYDALDHIILVRPSSTKAVLKLAQSHPNIRFTVVDAKMPPIYGNIRNVHFKDHEGAFLIGMISALTSQTGLVGFIGASDTPYWRNIGYGYYQGVKFVNNHADVHSDMASKNATSAALFEAQSTSNVDEVFVTGFDGLPQIYESAQRYHRHLVLMDPGDAAHPSSWQITSMTRRVDFAVRDTLRDIEASKWQPGIVELGIREGYIDYVLDEENKNLLPHEVIDRVEIAKDLIIRDVIQVKPYIPE